MNEPSTGQRIIEKIKQGHIQPRPRWKFLFRNYLTWMLFIMAIFVGSLAFGVIIFMTKDTDWQYYPETEGLIQKILITLPYFWLVILMVFAAMAFYNFRHTKKGYIYNPLLIVLLSVTVSIIIGAAVYATGGGEKLEDIFYRKMPFYQKIIRFHGRLLSAPQQGRIPGIIAEIGENQILIKDFQGGIWSITTSTDQFIAGQRVIIYGRHPIEEKFEAQMIQSWLKPRR
jgi:hypothetical protein